ncbi:MAG: hypothetical protein HY927_10315 [Elusimicrobia bacterium]|nr:hypothetical protein [Elusimicrobiota bacterium]
MTPEELHNELERLWTKVGASQAHDLASISMESVPTSDLTLDALSLFKRQQRQKEAGWAELLDAKEKAIEAYRRRQELLETELAQLRRRLDAEEGIIVGEVIDARSKLEAGMKMLELDRGKSESERRALEDILDATRTRLTAEGARLIRLQEEWSRREQQYLLDLKEFQTRAERHEGDASRKGSEADKLSGSLKEAKNALEKTLAELLRERQLREETEKERGQALKKVADLEKHFKELSLIWEEERSQWRELWDRERSTWETQRQEVGSWEAALRKERESWQAEIADQEKKHVEFVSKINDNLRESSETSARLASVIKILDAVGASGAAGRVRRVTGRKVLALVLVAAVGLAAVPLARLAGKPRLKAVASEPLRLENPTGLAFDGALVWVSQWDGEIVSFDPADLRTVLKRFAVKKLEPFRPAALAAGAEALWSLDSAQARIIKHRAGRPEEVLAILRAPGPAPCALAFDGTSLWLYDAATQAIYRQKGDTADFAAVPAETEMVPSAMAFVKGKLWVADSKTRELVVLELKDGKLRAVSRQPAAEPLMALSAADERVWALAGPSMERPGHAIVQYRY